MEHIYQNIEGWFDFETIYTEMVNKFDAGSHFVEIGSWLGCSTSYMAVEIINSGKNIKFDCIDSWEGSEENKDDVHVMDKTLYQQFLKNTNKVSHIINPIKNYSYNVVDRYKDNSIDFLFIDGAHDYDAVKKDITDWYPKIKKGGVIAGHDYFFNGVKYPVDEFFGKKNVISNGNSWVVYNNEINKKVIDSFIFYNELELLEFRLKELNDYVDYFVLVESKKTHSGNDKELYFENNKHLFKDYLHKIIHVIDDDLSSSSDITHLDSFKNTPSRIREENQRNSISKGLDRLNLNDEDIIIISDADEIINPNVIIEYKNKDFDLLALEQDFYLYNMNYKYPKIWTFPKVVKYKLLKESTPEDIRVLEDGDRIKNGGWHFSYFFGAQSISDKIKNFSHQEFNNDFYTNDEYINNCIKNGKYIFGDEKLEYVDIENNKNLPKNYEILVEKKVKHCFLITSYCDTDLKIEILNECVDNLKQISNHDICLHAHYPLNNNIQKSVNYYLYDKSNPILHYPEKFVTWWRKYKNYLLHIYKEDYGYAVLQQWKRGFDFLKTIYDNIIIINYDVIITKELLNKIENKNTVEGCSFLHENGNTIMPLVSIKTKSKLFDKISLNKYLEINGFAEDFVKNIYSDSNSYNFKFEEYKDYFYTMLDFDGNTKFKDNILTEHNSPHDIMVHDNFTLFTAVNKDGLLNLLFYDIKIELLYVNITYNNSLYDFVIKDDYKLINTNIDFDNINIENLIIKVNNKEVKFDRDIIKYCKIMKN